MKTAGIVIGLVLLYRRLQRHVDGTDPLTAEDMAGWFFIGYAVHSVWRME